jgi:hypothetical protein
MFILHVIPACRVTSATRRGENLSEKQERLRTSRNDDSIRNALSLVHYFVIMRYKLSKPIPLPGWYTFFIA